MKQCVVCGLSKQDSDFSWKLTGKKRSNECKTCHREWRIKYYQEHSREIEKAGVVRRKRELRAWIWEMKERAGCARCSEKHPACLDFHHVDANEKEINPAELVARGLGREAILRELCKCAVLCSNCHRKHHYEERRKIPQPKLRKGPRKPRVQLTVSELALVRERIAAGYNNCAIGREFGVSHSTISAIKLGKTWRNSIPE